MDNKGKLFGLFNIIDVLVILMVLAVIVVGAKRLKSVPSISSGDAKEGIVTFEVSEVRKVTADNIVVGDPLYEYDKGTYIGKIVEVESAPFQKEVDYQGKWVLADVPEKYKVTVKVQAPIRESQDYYVVGGEQMRIGSQTRVKNKRIATFANCMGIELNK